MDKEYLQPQTPIARLEKKVFVYDSSEGDKRYFKNRIVEFAKGNTDGKTFTQFLYTSVWNRNDGGRTVKYCFCSERNQRVYLEKDFFEWAKLILQAVQKYFSALKAA